MKPTRLRGLSDAYGSWKTIIISRRYGRISARDRCVMSRPSKITLPPVGSSSRMTQRAIVDLPQPDSPTTPSVSPSLTAKETPSTALTAPTCFWKMIPRVTGKCFFRFSTMRSSSPWPDSVSMAASRSWPGSVSWPGRRHSSPTSRMRLGPGSSPRGPSSPGRGGMRCRCVASAGVGRSGGLVRLADAHHVGAARVEPASRAAG